MTRTAIIIIFICFRAILFAQVNNQPLPLVPWPADLEKKTGTFLFTKQSVIHTAPQLMQEAIFFQSALKSIGNWDIAIQEIRPGSRNAPLTENDILLTWDSSYAPEAYRMELTTGSAYIQGRAAGVFYGIQTFMQLISAQSGISEAITLQGMLIEDAPRFPYRGLHLDVARHFFNAASVKRYLDYLAAHKLNYFHWHLTDDQGWRIPIQKYPKLTETGACRAQTLKGRYGSDQYDGIPYCGAYTREEIRDIIQYASERHITIIPEIDIPGHSLAALASYPYLGCLKGPYQVMETWGVSPEVLCAGNDSTYQFMQDVLTEVMALFPGPYIHIGGDECPKERWKTCTVCQQKIKQEKLKDEHELQSYFIRRMEKWVNQKGKKIIGWDEILEGGLAPNALVMSWRGEKGGMEAAKMKHPVIMSPGDPLYLNHAQSKREDSITQGQYNPLEAVYAYNPVPASLTPEEATYILGPQGNLWSEYIQQEAKLEYMLFPRIAALSEIAWTPVSRKSWPHFEARLPGILANYRKKGIRYSDAYYALEPVVVSLPGQFIGWQLQTRSPSKRIVWQSSDMEKNWQSYKGPVPVTKTQKLYAGLQDSITNEKPQHIISQAFIFHQAVGKKVTLAHAPNASYSQGGALSLVDGIQNTEGMLRSMQFSGYYGKDLDAVIDLGAPTQIREIIVHAFEQTGSWIYRPEKINYFYSTDNQIFKPLESLVSPIGDKHLQYRLPTRVTARYIRIHAKNPGIIRDGLPGAGHPAWIFFHEIEIH